MLPRVTDARYLNDYKLEIRFSDGTLAGLLLPGASRPGSKSAGYVELPAAVSCPKCWPANVFRRGGRLRPADVS